MKYCGFILLLYSCTFPPAGLHVLLKAHWLPSSAIMMCSTISFFDESSVQMSALFCSIPAHHLQICEDVQLS